MMPGRIEGLYKRFNLSVYLRFHIHTDNKGISFPGDYWETAFHGLFGYRLHVDDDHDRGF